MTKTKLHFGLLNIDTPMPEVLEKSGDYLQQFKTAFKKAADNEKITITWDAFDVVEAQTYPSLDDIAARKYDAFVLTGSKHNSYDDEPWILKLVDFVAKMQDEYADKVKLLGICFGHQIILRAAGGKTAKNDAGWEIGLVDITLTEQGKKFFKTDREFIKINQSHQDIVTVVPDSYRTLGFSKDNTPVQISASENKQCISIQGHPEYSRDTMMTLIRARMKQGTFEKDFAEKALDTLENAYKDVDDVWFCERMLEFVLNKL
ncbi:MAG: class I glutamine amidotransferase-like protein [Benjaminiella poitrasii]|nr:MAG: class I glutamine amidotransferase-like protein [Benjaminiella poitrasii]